LFDGQSLNGWSVTRFGGEGPVRVERGRLVLGIGEPLTGVTYAGRSVLPTTDYEIRLQARRLEGSDFFCGLTFPYGTSHATLIVGGWGGGLVGISSLAGQDASDNETTHYVRFENGRWYDIRVRVMTGFIHAWVDDKRLIACRVGERHVGTRVEVALSRPLGIATYQTKGEIRQIEMRRWSPPHPSTLKSNALHPDPEQPVPR
jgi:hypothetical protein